MIFKLEPDKPHTISLKSSIPQKVEGNWGPQLRWVLSNGDLLYTPLVVGPQIEDLGVKPGQPFTMTRFTNGRGFKWVVSKSQHAAIPVQRETQDAPRTTLKTPVAALLDHTENLDGVLHPVPPTRLEDALKTAVAAAAAAEQYGKSIGYAVRFAPADIKSLGISVYIGQQGGRYAA